MDAEATTGLRVYAKQSARHGPATSRTPRLGLQDDEHALQALCKAVSRCLEQAASQAYLRPLLTAHTLLGNLEAALALVKKVCPALQAIRLQWLSCSRQQPGRSVCHAR